MCAQHGGGRQESSQPSWMRVSCPEATASCPPIRTHPAIKKGNTDARPAYNHNTMHNANTVKPQGGGRNLWKIFKMIVYLI